MTIVCVKINGCLKARVTKAYKKMQSKHFTSDYVVKS